jgi:hypothetical protein
LAERLSRGHDELSSHGVMPFGFVLQNTRQRLFAFPQVVNRVLVQGRGSNDLMNSDMLVVNP